MKPTKLSITIWNFHKKQYFFSNFDYHTFLTTVIWLIFKRALHGRLGYVGGGRLGQDLLKLQVGFGVGVATALLHTQPNSDLYKRRGVRHSFASAMDLVGVISVSFKIKFRFSKLNLNPEIRRWRDSFLFI